MKNDDSDGSYNKLKSYIRNEIPLIRVLKLPDSHPLREYGAYVSLDNRRLFCFYMASLFEFSIPVLVLDYEQMEKA